MYSSLPFHSPLRTSGKCVFPFLSLSCRGTKGLLSPPNDESRQKSLLVTLSSSVSWRRTQPAFCSLVFRLFLYPSLPSSLPPSNLFIQSHLSPYTSHYITFSLPFTSFHLCLPNALSTLILHFPLSLSPPSTYTDTDMHTHPNTVYFTLLSLALLITLFPSFPSLAPCILPSLSSSYPYTPHFLPPSVSYPLSHPIPNSVPPPPPPEHNQPGTPWRE